MIDNRVGEPDLGLIPQHILPGRLPPELHKLFEFGYSIDRQGLPETLWAVADYYNGFNNLSGAEAIKPDQIVMADGARAAASVAATYIKKKCAKISVPRVLLLKPGYNLYNNQFGDFGFEIDEVLVPAELSDAEKINLIRKSLRPETIILPITNPNNPTGEIYSEKFLRGLLGLLEEFPNLHIISDSVYDRIIRKNIPAPKNIYALADGKERRRVFEVNGLAKSFAYPAIRVGWVIADEKVAAEIQEIKDPMLGPLNNIAQIVAIAALAHTPKDYHDKINGIYDERIKMVHESLHRIPNFKSKIPPGTFYYWADFSGTAANAPEIVKKLEKKNIFLSAGKKFGAPNCIRINCGVKDETLRIICDEIVAACR